MKGYRTYIAAALMGVFGALAMLDWNPILADPKAGLGIVATTIVMAVMRSVTDTPPGDAGAPAAPSVTPSKPNRPPLYGHAWLGVALVLALSLGGCAGAGALATSDAGGTMMRIGKAIYAVECKSPLPGLIGAGAVAVASVRAPDGVAARKARDIVEAHNAAIAAICPAARAVEVVAGGV